LIRVIDEDGKTGRCPVQIADKAQGHSLGFVV